MTDISNIDMKYVKFGKGKKVFVNIPGLSFKPVSFQANAIQASYKQFTDDYTVYLFDRRTNIEEGYSIEQMAEDTVCVMKNLGIESADIFGASQGGMITQYIAVNHPEMAHKIILASTMSKNTDVSLNVIKKWQDLAKENKINELVSSAMDDIYSENTLKAFRDVLIKSNIDLTEKRN